MKSARQKAKQKRRNKLFNRVGAELCRYSAAVNCTFTQTYLGRSL